MTLMKGPEHPSPLFGAVFWILASIALASTGMADEEVEAFDLLKMDHVFTGREKAGVIWGVSYGRTGEGRVSYAVFYDGSKPSPFAAKTWFRSNGEKGVHLEARHNGERIDPPDPNENILVILDDKVVRGHFESMEEAKFLEFLSRKQRFTVAGLEALSKEVDANPALEHSN